MSDYRNVTVVLPSLSPDEKLISTVKGIRDVGFKSLIIVDDGSGKDYESFFRKAGEEFLSVEGNTFQLLVHEVNKGKGQALKTAFDWYYQNDTDGAGVVTADGDGQHLPEDIKKCADSMCEKNGVVLGVRDFSLPQVPERSRKGNRITSKVFKIFFRMDISDTQTGLRAIPKKYLPEMLSTEGQRFEYENKMLLTLKEEKIPYSETVIETVYIEENKTSHFHTVRDSYRIYSSLFGQIFKYGLCSVFCLLFESAIQTVVRGLVVENGLSEFLNELIDFLPARLISSVLNYILNKKYVFKDKKNTGSSLVRYYVLWSLQAILTWLLTTFVVILTGSPEGWLYLLLTLAVKTAIFFASYTIQKKWVFKKK